MRGRVSADTNVVLYVASRDDIRADRATDLLKAGMTLSVQVLNESASVMLRKWQATWAETREFLARVQTLSEVRDITPETHRLGLDIAQRHKLRFYDGLIIASALEAGCDILYSEDMHHGLVVDGSLRLVNPFRPN